MSDDFKPENVRYIVFLIDSKYKSHDGMIFSNIHEAREYCQDVIDDHYADKVIMGSFVMEQNVKEMYISQVETFGFKGDKKQTKQLELFK